MKIGDIYTRRGCKELRYVITKIDQYDGIDYKFITLNEINDDNTEKQGWTVVINEEDMPNKYKLESEFITVEEEISASMNEEILVTNDNGDDAFMTRSNAINKGLI